jgi:hypothetical protein
MDEMHGRARDTGSAIVEQALLWAALAAATLTLAGFARNLLDGLLSQIIPTG